MSSIKDKLKSSQGAGNAYPKLNIVKKISIKEDGSKQPFFSTYVKYTGDVDMGAPIVGILIGTAMQMSSYSDNLGMKGGNYMSTYYLHNTPKIALFAPSPKGYDNVFTGDKDACEAYLVKESTARIAKKKQVLFVLTGEGLYAISTNLSIAIDQINANKDALAEKYIVLNPKLFREDDKNIRKNAKEWLGKFRQKNPPKFAEVTVGDLISEGDWEKWGGDKNVEEYKEWKKYVEAAGEKKEEQPTTNTQPTKMQPNHAENEGWPSASEAPQQEQTDDLLW